MRFFSVKNFEKFQHYKDRSPPWIKLYNELLDDYAFGTLKDASKWHLIAIWLLASRSDNKIPYDPTWVARRINASDEVDLAELVTAGFILLDQPLPIVEQPASGALATCLTREETEGEAEKSSVPNGTGGSPPTPEKQLFERAKQVLGKGYSGGLVAKVLKARDGNVALARAAIETASTKHDPAQYLGAIVRNKDPPASEQLIDPRLG